jgi:Flp pilus assembly protein TadG
VSTAHEDGQATVELALCLPVLVALALVVLQVVLVARDQVLVTHAAREAAREAAVTSDLAAVRRAAVASGALAADRLTVTVTGRGRPGSRAVVEVRYAAPTDLPVIGGLLGDVALGANAAIRVER